MAVFDPMPAQARAGMARLRLDRVLDRLTAATEEFVASERAFRSAARKTLAGIDLTDLEAQAEAGHNDLGHQHLNEALTEIANLSSVARGDRDQFNAAFAGAEGRQRIANARTAFAGQLAAHDLAPADMQEILSRWDTEAGQVTSFDSVVTTLQQRTSELRDVRSQPNRGREAGSVPLWKMILIAATIAASLAVVIACFVWFGCAWIAVYISWYAPSLAATINMGC